MAATSFPYFDRKTRTVQIGISCKGCQLGAERVSGSPQSTYTQTNAWYRRRDQMYTEDGFLEHFKECRESQEIWKSKLDQVQS